MLFPRFICYCALLSLTKPISSAETDNPRAKCILNNYHARSGIATYNYNKSEKAFMSYSVHYIQKNEAVSLDTDPVLLIKQVTFLTI